MKILRILFKNLNSLPLGEINLEDGPLARAGLFAITGPVGAGKSTLLDAVTLALYGRAARYESVPNPEDMMSRHTGRCQAEVVFEVKGETYRAEWQLRRARDRADGKLQPATRRIYNANGEVLAQNISEADKLIEKITGLDYGRFLRSVLLAQGQFAQFLKAGENQRAELLESLTGTTIYSDLGALAYRESTDRETALREREAALGRIALLTEEERCERNARMTTLAEDLARLTKARDAAAARIELGRQRTALQASEAALLQSQAALEQEKQAAEPERARLTRHQNAESFLPALQTLEALLERATLEDQATQDAQQRSAKARSRLAAGSAAAIQLANKAVESIECTLKEARQLRATSETAAATVEAWLAKNVADAGLETALPTIAGDLANLAAARRAVSEAEAAAIRLKKERDSADAPLIALEQQWKEAIEREKIAATTVADSLTALNRVLNGQTAEMILAESKKHEKKAALLAELRGLMEKRDAAAEEGLQLANEETALVEEVETIRAQRLVLEEEAVAQKKLEEGAQNHLSLLEQIAGLAAHRATLVDGQPCPLCGALNHPLIREGGEISHQIEDARRNLVTARAASATAATEAKLAGEHLAQVSEALKNLQQRRAKLRADQMADHEKFSTLGQSLRVYTTESLLEAEAGLAAARDRHEKRLEALRAAEQAKTASEVVHLKEKAETARLAEALSGSRTAIERLASDLAARQQAAIVAQSRAEEIRSQLAAALTPYALAIPESGAEDSLRAELEKRHRAYQHQAKEKPRLAAEIRQATTQIETLTRQLEEVAAKNERLASAHDPNVATDPLWVKECLAKWRSLADAETELETLRATLTREETAYAEYDKRAADVKAAAARQTTELEKALASSPFATIGALREARLLPDEKKRLEQHLAALDLRATELLTRLTQLREQAAKLREADAPTDEEIPALETERRAFDEQALTAAEARATIKAALDEDTRTRANREAEIREIEEARQRLATWLQLRDLIGSADGKKFSRFAQGLSLDILVRHANAHLRRLTDRYQIRRAAGSELALEITDLHQAGTIRPMASLSGGETFLASLALALGLSDLAGRNVRIDTLFIDEGFGTLDPELLDVALTALDTLRAGNKTIGIISHVELLKERIPVQIRVEKQAGGVSVLRMPGE